MDTQPDQAAGEERRACTERSPQPAQPRYQIAEVTRFVVVDTKQNTRMPTSYEDPEDAFRMANRRNRSAGSACLKRIDLLSSSSPASPPASA